MQRFVHGIGLGLRRPFAAELFREPPRGLRWLELHPENYLFRGGAYETLLERARKHYPLITHGLTMGFGAVSRVDKGYLSALRALLTDLDVPFHSDHLCFAGAEGVFAHDLLPLPFNRESIQVAVDRIHEAQDALGLPIAVEHISYYLTAPGSTLQEAEHLCEILERADAQLLLDVNNVYVNAQNHGFDPRAFIDELPLERVVQLHVAGHLVRDDGFRIDTHAEPVCEAVFALLEHTLHKLARPVPVLLERDDNFPEFSALSAEIERLDAIYRRALASNAVDSPEISA